MVGKDAMAVFDDTKVWDEKLAIYRHAVRSSDGVTTLKAEVES